MALAAAQGSSGGLSAGATLAITLGTVFLTGLFAEIRASRQAGAQRALHESEQAVADRERRRTEKARAFRYFLDAADGAWQRANDLYVQARMQTDDVLADRQSGKFDSTYRDLTKNETSALTRALLGLLVTANEQTRMAAEGYVQALQEFMVSASKAEWKHDATTPSRGAMLAALRAELEPPKPPDKPPQTPQWMRGGME